MKNFTILWVTAIATLASAKWDGKPPNTPTDFGSVVRVDNEAAINSSALAGNPFEGVTLYANSYYAKEVEAAIPLLKNQALAPLAKEIAKTPTFFWMDTTSKVAQIPEFVADAKKQGGKLAIPLVVYNLPERDCSALASNGELSLANGGEAKYKEYIDAIVKELKAAASTNFILVIEPDSLANLVTNMDVQKCKVAEPGYRSLTKYAIQQLNLPNVNMYLDAGHAGWLGWPNNINRAAELFASIYKDAGSLKAVRGLVTNTANYNAWSYNCNGFRYTKELVDARTSQQLKPMCDEKAYINELGPKLRANGFPASFIVDTSRNGRQPTGQDIWGDWCNVMDTGFGIRPGTPTEDNLLDAFVWVKPGGECDGTSNTSAARYDGKCGSKDALKPAPEAGTWFQAYFEQLLQNVNLGSQTGGSTSSSGGASPAKPAGNPAPKSPSKPTGRPTSKPAGKPPGRPPF